MIELPRHYLTSAIATSKPANNKGIRFEVIADEQPPPLIAVERRRTPSRRKPSTQQGNNTPIDRRVSHDRRRHAFSSKA